MVTKEYKQYLKSAKWQRKRQQMFAKYGRKCAICGTRKPPLQGHHLSYNHLFNEPLSDLRPVCVKCHKALGSLHYKMGRRKTDGLTVFRELLRLYRAGKYKP